jgi:hypothetical protein
VGSRTDWIRRDEGWIVVLVGCDKARSDEGCRIGLISRAGVVGHDEKRTVVLGR